MHPGGEIAGAGGDEGVLRQILAEPHHDLAEVDAAGLRRRLLGPVQIVVVRGLGLRAPGNLVRRLQAFQRRGKAGRRRVDGQMRMIDAAELLGAGMDMHEGLPRPGNVEQRIALRGNFAEPAADQHDQVGRLDAGEQLRIDAEADVAGVARVQRVDQMGAAEGGGDRHREALGEARQRRASRPPTSGCRRPARSATSRPITASAISPCRRDRARSRPARRPARPAPRRARPACPRAAPPPPGRAGRCRRCRRRATRSRGCAPDRRSRSPISPSSRTPRGSRAPGTPRARASRGRPGRRTRSAAWNPAWRCGCRARRWWRPARGCRTPRRAGRSPCRPPPPSWWRRPPAGRR